MPPRPFAAGGDRQESAAPDPAGRVRCAAAGVGIMGAAATAPASAPCVPTTILLPPKCDLHLLCGHASPFSLPPLVCVPQVEMSPDISHASNKEIKEIMNLWRDS
jgi:hypothetical protein